MTASAVLDVLEEIITTVVESSAADFDRAGTSSRASVTASGRGGLPGLLSAHEVGSRGGSLEDAPRVARRLASACQSTATVVCMHDCAAIEQYGPADARGSIALGSHVSTLAFPATGSPSRLWAPLGTAPAADDRAVLDAGERWFHGGQ